MTHYTKGKLEAYTRGITIPAIREVGRPDMPDGGHIASFASYRDTQEATANRDRMLACWNACKDMTDPGEYIANMRVALHEQSENLREALDALDLVMARYTLQEQDEETVNSVRRKHGM